MRLRCGCGQPIALVDVPKGVCSCPTCHAVLLRVPLPSPHRARPVPAAFSGGVIAQSGRLSEAYRDAGPPTGKRWVYRRGRSRTEQSWASIALWLLIAGGAFLTSMVSDALSADTRVALALSGLPFVWMAYSGSRQARRTTTIELGPLRLTATSVPPSADEKRRGAVARDRNDVARFEARKASDDSFYVHAVGFDGRATLVLAELSADEATYLATELDDEIRRHDPVD